jgi:cytochrome c-type biogenesis protein CcmE
MKNTHIIGIIMIVVAIGLIIILLSDPRYYSNFKTAAQNPETSFDIIGVRDTTVAVVYDAKVNAEEFSFFMTDDQGNRSEVICHKAKPQNFEHTKKVVISGSMKGGKFHATNILLKCPSKYESEGKPSEFGEKKI